MAGMGMEAETSGTRTLLGNQRKGIVALAIPIGVALLFQQLNNIVDSIWVADLGGDALAALGLVYPIYSVLIGIGNGLGIGVSAAIARNIGMKNSGDARGSAGQGVLLAFVVGLILTPILLLTAEPSLLLMGAGDMIGECLEYAYPIYICTFFIILSGIMSGMLRGEGAARRSMAIQIVGALVNIILDPIMIYGMGMGVAGAAWATSISFAVSCAMAAYWYLRGKHMYVTLSRSSLRYDRRLCRSVLSVGAPEALELSVMYIFNVVLNLLVIQCGGTDAVGIYSTGWRVAYIIMVVAQAMGGAMVAVCSAEYGMKRFDMIQDAFRYTVVSAFLWTAGMGAIMALSAGFMADAFTRSDDLAYLNGDMADLFRLFALCLPVMTMVYTGSSLLQALDRATGAMLNSLLRNLLLCASFYIALVAFGTLGSMFWAMALTEILGGVLMGMHAWIVLRRVIAREAPSDAVPGA